ncbi:hypothetical protein G6F50_018649 [Rhizopus delemar]|uniref:Uncharacterized protein n=1 Tax=Rhizopus delemar TaxID=936053 RepID=A0A9P7BYZ4_9FUNG|nr:hypothetical protein G6F50_018649 [Rhizopus delemar]
MRDCRHKDDDHETAPGLDGRTDACRWSSLLAVPGRRQRWGRWSGEHELRPGQDGALLPSALRSDVLRRGRHSLHPGVLD